MFLGLIQQSGSGSGMTGVIILAGIVVFILVLLKASTGEVTKLQQARLSDEEQANIDRIKRDLDSDKEDGPLNPAMVCPHCKTKGVVRTKQITQKQGISGGKATAALLTGGVSLVAVGLSKKGQVTQAHCDHCNNGWMF